MVQRELARLRRVFRQALLLSAAASGGAGAYACSTGGGGRGGADGSSPDGAGAADGAGTTEAASSADTGDEEDASPFPPGCAPGPAYVYDAAADAPNCAYRVALPCGLPSFVTSIDPVHCVMPFASCLDICTGSARPFLSCEVANGFGCDDDAGAFVAADGAPIVVECDRCTIAGRRPRGLRRVPSARGFDVVGRFLAHAAHLEAASIPAFTRLAEDLDAHGAPRPLVRAALRAAADESRHFRAMARLARTRGAHPPPVRIATSPRPCLTRLARENAVEGCVRETFGALLACWQARHARDPHVARAFTRIARDETRHAALAWAIAGWIEPRLDASARRDVRRARRRAVASLRRAITEPPASLRLDAGLPTARQAVELITRLEMGLLDTGDRAMGA
jgi:hypothetical protein